MTKKQALEEIVSPKVNELKKIFEECREEMEWKAMETNVYEEVSNNRETKWLKSLDWNLKLKEKLISLAESHDVIQQFTTLNNEFTKGE
ncbi:unnamed protein product [Rhizophagus irregularis]|nr:unnamed protein product [Rhizophagus irregularis]